MAPTKKKAVKKKVVKKKAGANTDEFGLNLKQREFSDLYRGGPDDLRGNAKRCYMETHPRAGEKTAEVNGCKWLRNTKIAKYIKAKSDEVSEKCGINAQWVLNQAVAVHERCMQSRPVLDKKGDPVLAELEDGTLTPAYAFDASGANKALEIVGKHVDVKAFEKEKIDIGLTVVIEDKDAQA